MTSFSAAGGSGRSTSVIPAVPAAWSVTTIAFMGIVSSVICLLGALMGACRSRTNADDRLTADPLGRIEGRDGIVEGQAVYRPRLGRAGDGHQCSSGPDHACGPPLDVSADDVEYQVDAADVFQRVVLKVDELHRAEVERLLTVDGASGADDIGAELTCELRHHRSD